MKIKNYNVQIPNTSVELIEKFREILKECGYVTDAEFYREKMREVVKNGRV